MTLAGTRDSGTGTLRFARIALLSIGEAFRKADVMELHQMRLCPFQDLFVGEVRDLSLLRIMPARTRVAKPAGSTSMS